MQTTKWLAGLTMAAGLAIAPAQAQKSADTLRFVNYTQIPDFTPYYNQIRDGIVIGLHAWDGLTYRDPETFKPMPLLATAWRSVDDTTIEFDLRKGVKFHDGSPFTADDVVFTYTTITHEKQITTPSNYAWLAGVDKVDDYKVRVKLKQVFPAAIEYITMVLPIIPKAYYEKVGGAEGYSKAPIGAGPYRITRVVVPSEVDFERFDGYYDGSPKGKPAIGKMVFHEVTGGLLGSSGFDGVQVICSLKLMPLPNVVGVVLASAAIDVVVGDCADEYNAARLAVSCSIPDSAA